jgi:DNA-directed RNA polymerase alpha subunit
MMQEPFNDPFSPYARGHYALNLRKQGKSFRDIAKELNVSIERARQIVMRAEKAAERYKKFAELKELCSVLIKRSEVSAEILGKSADDLNLSVRASTCLRNGKITTIGELISKPKSHIETFRNTGKKTIYEIEDALNELGLGFANETYRGYQ